MKMPDTVYVQTGLTATPTGTIEEYTINSTPEKALARNLGPGREAGNIVGIYKLDRVVKIAIGITEIPISTETPATTEPTPTAANT
jgi:hypothetical protein